MAKRIAICSSGWHAGGPADGCADLGFGKAVGGGSGPSCAPARTRGLDMRADVRTPPGTTTLDGA